METSRTDGRKIIANANKQKRTYTLRVYNTDGTVNKYRTLPMTKEEFQSNKNNTTNDWNNYLKSDDYYLVNRPSALRTGGILKTNLSI